MYCSKCGQKNEDSVDFCLSCHASMRVKPDLPVATAHGTVAQMEAPQYMPPGSVTVDHALVWIATFIPFLRYINALIVGSVYPAAFQNIEIAQMVGMINMMVVVIVNTAFMVADEHKLRAAGLDTRRLQGVTQLIVPLYLFKRPAVTGGGYGYAVLWMVSFMATLLFDGVFVAAVVRALGMQ
jgi:hypothetical protein